MAVLTICSRRFWMFLLAASLVLSMDFGTQYLPVAEGLQPALGDYVVTEWGANVLSRISAGGVRTLIYNFSAVVTAFNPQVQSQHLRSTPAELLIDSSGNYVVAEYGGNVLSRITPSGVRSVIYSYTFTAGPDGIAVDSQGNYIVTESIANKLSKITPLGVRTVIYSFPANTFPAGVAVDSEGNYIVAELGSDVLSKITPGGVRTVVYNFAVGSCPDGVVIDSQGKYIVTEGGADVVSRITAAGLRTVVHSFGSGTWPDGVTIDPQGNYIITAYDANMLYKVTPGGVRTALYSFVVGTEPEDVAVVVAVRPTFSAFEFLFGSNLVRVVYPSSGDSKPLGCGAAMVSDWLASMAVSTKLRNMSEGLDTDGDFVNQTSGRAVGGNGSGVVTFGGLFVNPVVKYAESESTPLADRAPVKFYNGGDTFYFQYRNGTNIPGASLPLSVINSGEDMFVVEVFRDGGGRYLMVCYGFGWKGTYAAGKYFHGVVYPSLDGFRVGWIVVKWEDTNGDGFVNAPGDGDTYTVVAMDSTSS